MAYSQTELQVMPFAKNLCSYGMTVTQKTPKQFRFSLIGRMQGYAPDIAEERCQRYLWHTRGLDSYYAERSGIIVCC